MYVACPQFAKTVVSERNATRGEPIALAEFSDTRMLLHDLRKLTQSVIAPLETLEMALEEHNIDFAMKSLKRLKEMANRVADTLGHFTRDSSTDHDRTKKCDISQEVEHVVHLLTPLSIHRRIKIYNKVVVPMVALIEKMDLHRLLLNLLVNSIEAITEPGGRVVIMARPVSKEWMQIEIADNGNGIQREDIAHIFDEGYTTKARQGGSGLGLTIVQKIANRYHGCVRAWSHPGKGARFVVRLPRESEEDSIMTTSFSNSTQERTIA